MTDSGTRRGANQPTAAVTIQLPLAMINSLEDVRERFFALCVTAGREVLDVLMEQDRSTLCGPRWARQATRRAGRGGTTRSWITLGGRQIEMRRPRVRSVDGREVELPSFRWAAARDPLEAKTLAAVLAGVSTRQYGGTLDPLPPGEPQRLVAKSSVSRRFVALSTYRLKRWMARPLDQLDLWAIKIDGIVFRGHCILIALGITADGKKHVLGVHEGTTENATVTKALLAQLIERGLPADRALLFIIDGAKALRKAIRDTYGALALIQRCQVHKRRNVRQHVPPRQQARVARVMEQAYSLRDAAAAERLLEQLARSLEDDHPGAAAALREGLAETLTLQRLGIAGPLYRSLRSTNTIENVNGSVAHLTRNVRRWRSGTMVQRWVVTAVCEAETHFNRINGYREMHVLIAALQNHAQQLQLDTNRRVA